MVQLIFPLSIAVQKCTHRLLFISNMPGTTVNTFSVFYIAKNDYTSFDELVVGECRKNKMDVNGGQLYYRIRKDYYPSWVNSFFGEDKLKDKVKLFKSKSVAAVYLTKIDVGGEDKTFAIAFGAGRYLLIQECIQREFGLVTSRHSIDPSRISSMSTVTYDSNIKSKTINSSTEIAQNEFFLNANTDVLTSVKGRVRSDTGADLLIDRIIGGKDSVSISARVDVSNLHTFLEQLYTQYINEQSNGVTYVSNIRKLTSASDIKNLEDLIEQHLSLKSQEGKVYLSLPSEYIKDENGIKSFLIHGEEYEELPEGLLNNYQTVECLKNTIITINFNNEDVESLRMSLYRFVCAEVEDDDGFYVAANGDFYRVTKSYLKKVNQFYNSIKISPIKCLNEWKGEVEGDYNKSHNSETFLVMDKMLIYTENTSKFEFCDLLTIDKQIVHTKIYKGGSQSLGHLFNQGLISARGMIDEDIRKSIQSKIQDVQHAANKEKDFSIGEIFKASDYTIIFLILCGNNYEINNKDKHPNIPFFAKAVCRENISQIQGMGFNVEILGINKKRIDY